MRIIHLARKPLSESSVAANVLEHGAGGLNVDACRIETGDNLNGGTYSPGGNLGGLPGDDRTGAAAGMFAEGGGRIPGAFVQPSGRWPANVVLQHRDGCRCTGTTKIPGTTRKPTGKPIYQTDGGSVKWNPNDVRDTAVRGHADEEGLETIATWDCEPDCPVADLDGQSGILKSGNGNFRKNAGADKGGHQGYAYGAESRPSGAEMISYGDKGGASRFYKQVGGVPCE